MIMSREYNIRLIRFAKEKGRKASFLPKTSHTMGYIVGTQRVVSCVEVEPVSMSRFQIRVLLNWALTIYQKETPNEFERGIVCALYDILEWLDDNPS